MDSPKEAMSLSVQDRTELQFGAESPIVMYVAQMADTIPEKPCLARDIALDAFWPQEPILSGAIYSMSAKIAALDFKLTGPIKAVSRSKRMLMNAEFGAGWIQFVMKVTRDILTQDSGGYVELIRSVGNSATAPVIAIAHIDAQRCIKTGNPLQPVQYMDITGKVHLLQWYEVMQLVDFPSARATDLGMGMCAVSRVLNAARMLRDVGLYKRQKLSGKRVPALIFVQGVRRNAVQEAMQSAQEEEVMLGNTVYTKPIILASPDPGNRVDAKLVELAGLPDGYDEDTLYKWYIATIALGFGTDYSEFAPVGGNAMGGNTQINNMAARSRGKGPGLLLQQFEYGLNHFILPRTVTFQFSASDPAAEDERIQLRFARAKERAVRVNSGEITPLQALKLAVSEGDAPNSMYEETVRNIGPSLDSPTEDMTEYIVRSYNDIYEAYQKVESLCREQKIC